MSAHAHGGHAHGHAHAHADGKAHSHHHDRVAAPRRALTVALVLTATFLVAEVVVGIWSGSLALLADAGHMMSDVGGLGMSLAAAYVASRPRSPQKTYGYRRAEVLGAMVNAVTLGVAGVWIVMEATHRIGRPPEIRGLGMLITAALGLGVNLVSAWFLSTRGGGGINVRSALAHVLGDALGSVAAIAAGLFVVVLDWRIADPIASICIALLVMYSALRLLRETTHVLMEGTPEGLDPPLLESTIRDTPGVASVHDLHVWCVTPGEPVLTAHVVLDNGAHGTDVASRVGDRLRLAHGILHVTIQPEAPESALVKLRKSRDS